MSTKIEAITSAFVFPSGDSRPLAVLAAEPDALAGRLGLRFADGLDDLDRFRYAVVDLGGLGRAWLYKHEGDPNPGTVVRIDAAVDPHVARKALIARLVLAPDDVSWWSPLAR